MDMAATGTAGDTVMGTAAATDLGTVTGPAVATSRVPPRPGAGW